MKKYMLLLSYALINVLISCNKLTDYIPPDFEEKLCINAVINNGIDQNMIIIEKTFQSEYPLEINASLENLSVSIKTESNVVFEYYNPKSDNRIDTVYLPAGLEFLPGQKYKLIISEKNSETINSEVIVPSSPAISTVNVEGSTLTFLQPPGSCHNPVKSIILNMNFMSEKDCFYYLDIAGYLAPWLQNLGFNHQDYEIIESNTPYFKTLLYGFKTIGFPSCFLTPFAYIPTEIYQPYFFDSKTIPGKICTIKIKININKNFDYTRPIRITLNSIPKELYNYEKSYKTFFETQRDPFSEPVYLRGNIKAGYGIFSICNGSQSSLLLPSNLLK
ncbi:MAG: DUF4249 family protein [Methanococcaceae archaeon]